MRVLLTLLLAASGQASSWHSLLTADLGIFMNMYRSDKRLSAN
jgi:hypothetical protein